MLPITDANHLSFADLLTYCTTDVQGTHKVYGTISSLSRSGVLTVNSA